MSRSTISFHPCVIAARFALCVIVLFAATLIVTSPAAAHEGGPHVRIAHLAPAAPNVDIYVDGTKAAENLKYRDVTDYIGLEGYSFDVFVVPAGEVLENAINKEPFSLTFEEGDGGFYTVAAVGSPSDNTFTVFMLPADGAAEQSGEDAPVTYGSATVGNLSITNAFVRATATGKGMGEHDHPEATMNATESGSDMMMSMTGVSAAYMTITNTGDTADRLISVSVEVAGVVEIHETRVENDTAQMIPMLSGVEVPANGSVELKPGSYHIMLLNLKQDLVAGESVTLVLNFSSGVQITLVAPVIGS